MDAPSAAHGGGEISGADLEGEHEKPTYDFYELGKSLEKMTDEILRHMNYKTEMRQKLEEGLYKGTLRRGGHAPGCGCSAGGGIPIPPITGT